MAAVTKVLLVCLCCAFLLVGCAGIPPSDSIPEQDEEIQLEEQGIDVAPNAEQGRLEASGTRPGPDKRERKRLVAVVNAMLPAGYRITRTVANTTPPDWHTNEPKAGFLIEGSDGKKTFRICFLPRDWIGIRKRPNDAPLECYWEGILDGERYKTITAGDYAFQTFRDRLPENLGTPSLINSGYDTAVEKIFRGRVHEADRVAQMLVRKHCKTPEEFAEAAASLVVLGVPAETVFRQAALEVNGLDKDQFCSALGLLGGKEAIGVLCEVVVDAKHEDLRRGYAATALDRHADSRVGPVLHKAIKELSDSEAVARVAKVLMHQRYVLAAPDVLAAMERIKNDSYKVDVAQCLAGMRYRKAIPEVRKLADELRRRTKAGPGVEAAELALQRLTDDWGTEGKTRRVRLSAPATVVEGDRVLLRIDVENIGANSFPSWGIPVGLVINGRMWGTDRGFGGGLSFAILPGEVFTYSWDLTEELKEPGQYTLKYNFGDGCSNEITIRVQAPEKH